MKNDDWWHSYTRFNLLGAFTLQDMRGQGFVYSPKMYFHVNQSDALYAVGEWIIRVSKWYNDKDNLFVEIHKQMSLNYSPYLVDGHIGDR